MQRLSLSSSYLSLPWIFRRINRLFANNLHLTTAAAQNATGEKRIEDLLKSNLEVDEIMVRDISGGCGSMYEIYVAARDFKDKRTIQQHRLVNEILKDEVKQMHGLRIHTKVPE